ncbi:MAG: hypothetical protein K2L04_05005 [Alistipes sp.]|nr:hypothetical protein [Alistipes sp.]
MKRITSLIADLEADFQPIKNLITTHIPYANNLRDREWNKIQSKYKDILEDILISQKVRKQHLFDFIIVSAHPDFDISSKYQYFIKAINTEIDKALAFATTHPKYKYKVKNIITNMITSIDDNYIQNLNEDFKNWINELFVFNFLLTCPNYTIVDMERRLSNGKSADYLFRHNTTNEDFYIDIVTLQKIDPAKHETSETFNDFIKNRIQRKYDDKFGGVTENGVFRILPIIEYKKGMEKFDVETPKEISLPIITICNNFVDGNDCVTIMEINRFLSQIYKQHQV